MIGNALANIKRLLFYALVIFVVWAIASAVHLSPAEVLNKILVSVFHQFVQLITGKNHLPSLPKIKK